MKYLLIIIVLYWNGPAETFKYDVPEGKVICDLMGATAGISISQRPDVKSYTWECIEDK